jgi:hypothetical protein
MEPCNVGASHRLLLERCPASLPFHLLSWEHPIDLYMCCPLCWFIRFTVLIRSLFCVSLCSEQNNKKNNSETRNKSRVKMNKQIEQSSSSVRARIRFVSTVSKPLTQRMWFGKIPYVTLISNYLVQRKVCAIPYVRLISNHLVQRSSAAKYLQLLTRTHGCSYCRAYAISLY